MTSTSSITQHVTRDSDLAVECSDASGRKTIFFNVSKVYERQDTYVFESTTEIRCGEAYYLKVKQTGKTQYTVTGLHLSLEELHAIVNNLFSDTLVSLKEFRERDSARHQDKNIPDVTLSTGVLITYLSSPNYHDLCNACGIPAVK